MAFRSRVISVVLCEELKLFADTVSPQRVLNLEVPELEGLLPHADALSVEWLLDGVSNNQIDWNIKAYVGWDRNHELASGVNFFGTDQSSNGPQLAAPSNFTSTNWRRHVRLELVWGLTSGVTVPKEARLSAILYVTTKGM